MTFSKLVLDTYDLPITIDNKKLTLLQLPDHYEYIGCEARVIELHEPAADLPATLCDVNSVAAAKLSCLYSFKVASRLNYTILPHIDLHTQMRQINHQRKRLLVQGLYTTASYVTFWHPLTYIFPERGSFFMWRPPGDLQSSTAKSVALYVVLLLGNDTRNDTSLEVYLDEYLIPQTLITESTKLLTHVFPYVTHSDLETPEATREVSSLPVTSNTPVILRE